MMDILDRLKSEWSSEYALQPTNEASRKVVIEIQALKKEAANEIESLRAQLSKPQPTSQDVVDAARYHCLCSMATNDYERSVGYQFVGKLNDFVDDIKPCVDEALAERKEDK